METLHKYAGKNLLRRWAELIPYYIPVTEGNHLSIDPIPFKRELYAGTQSEQTDAAGAGRKPLTTCSQAKPNGEAERRGE